MQSCERCGPEKSYSECPHVEPVEPAKLTGMREELADELFERYFLGYVTLTPEKEVEEEDFRNWLIRASGWDTKPLSELRKELEKFDKSPGH